MLAHTLRCNANKFFQLTRAGESIDLTEVMARDWQESLKFKQLIETEMKGFLLV